MVVNVIALPMSDIIPKKVLYGQGWTSSAGEYGIYGTTDSFS